MQFDLLRLVLIERAQVDAFERSGGRGMNRESFLRAVFSERIEFIHFGGHFHFVPVPAPPNMIQIVGRIGRPHLVVENEPPEEGLSEVDREAWIASSVVIDPTHHGDGQKAAFELKQSVGKPLAVFRSLAQHINSRTPVEPYIIEVNPIVDPETFWQFEEENRDTITAIEFDLIAPNMFGTRDEFDAEMKGLRDHERAQKAKLGLENRQGLKLDTPRVRTAVGYALEGGGRVRAKAGKRRRFDSNKKGKRVTIAETPDSDRSFFGRIETILRALIP